MPKKSSRALSKRATVKAPWPPSVAVRVGIAAAVIVSVYVGWRLFWFLTDDAFIAFRYVSNSILGYGLVWNPPPFKPVEGYTSFLWVFLLKVIWQVTGTEPPQSANWLSLAFGYATLFVGYRFLERLTLPVNLARYRIHLLVLVFLGTITNRTFLTWLSSGLETSLFTFCLTWWIYCALTPRDRRDPRWLLSFSLSSALTALCRPDGLLFFAASLLLIAVHLYENRDPTKPFWYRVAGMVPLLAVPAHLLFRLTIYGQWLPNTYYAKHAGAWPESGLRYLLCFLLEYGVWVWLILVAVWIVVSVRSKIRFSRFLPDYIHIFVTITVIVLHVAYYTFVIGGDHFEYRVYSHLVLLLFISAVWLVSRITSRTWLALVCLILFLLASWPVPWAHWQQTRHLSTREETYKLIRPIADDFPRWVRPVIERWDEWQAWLIRHHVGMRHQEHKVFYEFQVDMWPTREEGSRISWERRTVMSWGTVGVPGWVYPGVAIIDLFGLNDRVIARSPPQEPERLMAHDRSPPPGYVECFRPVARAVEHGLEIRRSVKPLTDEEIRACEERDWF